MIKIRCVVERITYQNQENGYSVMKVKVKGYSDLVTLVGNLLDVPVGAVLLCNGEWKMDKRYGQQFACETWEEGYSQIFEAVLENKPFILNVYHSVSREKIESFLYKLTYQLIVDVVEEKCSRDHLPEEDKQFIADFYKYGFVGIMLDWIDRGMKEDYQKIVELLAVTLHGNITNSIRLHLLKVMKFRMDIAKMFENFYNMAK